MQAGGFRVKKIPPKEDKQGKVPQDFQVHTKGINILILIDKQQKKEMMTDVDVPSNHT